MSKLTIGGIIFVALGIIAGFIQNNFYGYVDSNGILHDSLFLPIAWLLTAIGVVLLLVSFIKYLIKK